MQALRLLLLAVALGAATGRQACSSTEQLAAAAGYVAEPHAARTEDGYLLTVHRLRGRRAAPRGPPVLLVHGLSCASHLWLLRGPGHALGYLLVDHGYDVWMPNFRGNIYSSHHEHLNTSDPEFWKFSWHEMGERDLPASVDLVLAATGWPRLLAVGHSMGSSALLVLLARRPQYAARVALASLLSPVSYVHRLRLPLADTLLHKSDALRDFFRKTHTYRIPPATEEVCTFFLQFCADGSNTQQLCSTAMQSSYGWNPEGLNKTLLGFYLSHLFAGVSIDTVAHFLQVIKSGRFEALDRGPVENVRRYGSQRVPAYPLHNVVTPVALYYSDNDYEQHPEGVARLARELPSVAAMRRVPDPAFNHMDFILHRNVRQLLYSDVIKLMRHYS